MLQKIMMRVSYDDEDDTEDCDGAGNVDADDDDVDACEYYDGDDVLR